MNDGRGLVALGLLTLLGARLVRGSRGVVRAGRKIPASVYQTRQRMRTRIFAGFQSYSQYDREAIRASTKALAEAFVSAVNADLMKEGRPVVALPIWIPTIVERPHRGEVGVEFEIDMSDYPAEVPFGPSVEKVFQDYQVEVLD
jgi:hypothetical protein